MSYETFGSLLLFAFVSSISPGPNNFMLLASGVNFGFYRTIPHAVGIALGFGALLLCVGFGLGAVTQNFPAATWILKIIGGGYLLYLAYKIAMTRTISGAELSADKAHRPMSILQAALFQWVNPKAWVMASTAMVLYTNGEQLNYTVLLVTVAFVLVNFPSVSFWAGFGSVMRGFLSDPKILKRFNITMGILLALTLIPILSASSLSVH